MNAIGVALLGLGNVGGGVVKLLHDNAAAIEARLGARLEVRAIAVRDPAKANRVVEVDPKLLTTDIEAAIRRDDIGIVCELMGGTTTARTAVLAAIAAGKHVVTANKALHAEHPEVFAAAERAGTDIYYVPRCAAVCRSSACCARVSRRIASSRCTASSTARRTTSCRR